MKKKLIEQTPNFTIITTGGCAASCSFCTDPMNYKQSPNYMANLIDLLLNNKIPKEFQQVSISGGEPTQSKDLPAILSLIKSSKRFKKVVLTTNGYRLLDHLEQIAQTVHFVNVSRHDIGDIDNQLIFKTDKIAFDLQIKQATEYLSKFNIPVTINHVYTDDYQQRMTIQYVDKFVQYAKELGATDICFRYDQSNNTLDETWFEKLFSDYTRFAEGGCPVCRSFCIKYKGMIIKFKASFEEPSKTTGEVYELIYHVNGKLVTDWSGQNEFNIEKYNLDYEVDVEKELCGMLDTELKNAFNLNLANSITHISNVDSLYKSNPHGLFATAIKEYKDMLTNYYSNKNVRRIEKMKNKLYYLLIQEYPQEVKSSIEYKYLLEQSKFLDTEYKILKDAEKEYKQNRSYNSCGDNPNYYSCGG